MSIDRVLGALRSLRLNPVMEEAEIHVAIAARLAEVGIHAEHEASIGPRCRIDFLTQDGVGIEVKKGKPAAAALLAQAARYAACDPVASIVLVVERNVCGVPSRCNGKPVHYVALNSLWGMAI